jgi:hypothetical protein
MPIRKRDEMTDSDWDELDATVQAKLPGRRVVRRPARAGSAADAAAHRLPVDVETPELAVLRAKYLRRAQPGVGDATRAGESPTPADGGPDDQDAIVEVEREGADPSDLSSRPKSVVVNRRGDVLGAQG